MVDMTDLSAMHGSEASAARLRKRRAAEFRLKAYGIGAIALAGLALFALLGSVVGKAQLALTETSISIPVQIPAEEIGDDPARANYGGLVKDALKERFPALSGRRDRRELYGVVSGGAQFELREAVLADPSLVGSAAPRALLASDDADLYVKGEFGDLLTLESEGALTPTGTEGAIELHSTANDFSAQLAAVKEALLDQARLKRVQAARQENGRAVRAAEAAAATDEATRELAV